MPTQIIFEYDPKTGEITYEVEGMVGTKCTDITSVLTANKKVVAEELKNSYYENQDRPDWITQGE